jgi:hypothetical protein
MNPIIRNILAVIVGVIVGGIVNYGIIEIGYLIIPPPEGTDVTTPEGFEAAVKLFQPINFIMPFLAHALGTFVGALLAALIAANRKMIFALVIGLFFLAGGIYMIILVPSPTWFTILDLVVAYIPMAFIAGKLVEKKK